MESIFGWQVTPRRQGYADRRNALAGKRSDTGRASDRNGKSTDRRISFRGFLFQFQPTSHHGGIVPHPPSTRGGSEGYGVAAEVPGRLNHPPSSVRQG